MIRETFSVMARNFLTFLRLGVSLYVLSVVVTRLAERATYSAFGELIVVAAEIASFVMQSWAMVAWLRYLVNEEQINSGIPRVPIGSVLKNIGLMILLFVLFSALFAVIFFPIMASIGFSLDGFLDGDTSQNSDIDFAVLTLVVVFLTFVLLMLSFRFSPMVTSAAVGKIIWFKESWLITRGHKLDLFLLTLFLFGALIVVVLILGIFSTSMLLMGPGFGVGSVILETALPYLSSLFLAVWASVFYRRVTGLGQTGKLEEVFD